MSVTVVFACGGCGAKAEGTAPLRKTFRSTSGRNHGFGTVAWENTPEDVAPEGWIAADPVTFCTYCPTCWASIEAAEVTT